MPNDQQPGSPFWKNPLGIGGTHKTGKPKSADAFLCRDGIVRPEDANRFFGGPGRPENDLAVPTSSKCTK